MDRIDSNKRKSIPRQRLLLEVAETRRDYRRLDLGPATSFLYRMICVIESERDNYRNVGVVATV